MIITVLLSLHCFDRAVRIIYTCKPVARFSTGIAYPSRRVYTERAANNFEKKLLDFYAIRARIKLFFF